MLQRGQLKWGLRNDDCIWEHGGHWRAWEKQNYLSGKQEILGGVDTRKMGGGEGGGDSKYSQLFHDFA